MYIVIGLAVGLILAGLVIVVLAGRPPGMGLLGLILKWVGIVLIILGLIFLIARPMAWLDQTLRSALGVGT